MCLFCEKKRAVIICDLCLNPFGTHGKERPPFHAYREYLHLMGLHLALDHGLRQEQIEGMERVQPEQVGIMPTLPSFTVPNLDGGVLRVATEWKPNPDYTPGQEYRCTRKHADEV